MELLLSRPEISDTSERYVCLLLNSTSLFMSNKFSGSRLVLWLVLL